MQLMTQYLNGVREKWACLTAFCFYLEKLLTHSLTFPCRRNHVPRRSLLALTCAALRRDDANKVKLFLLFSLMHPSFFFQPVVCWNFSARNLDFYKGSVSCGWLSQTVFPRGSQTVAKLAWARTKVSMYYPWQGCVRLLLGSLAYDAKSHRFHKGTFVHEWMPIFWERMWARDVLFGHVADVTCKAKFQLTEYLLYLHQVNVLWWGRD